MIHYYLTFFTRLRLPISISQRRGTKKVLWTVFARALNPKSEEEIKLFELLISVSRRRG